VGAEKVDSSAPDPVGTGVEADRPTRDEIDRRVRDLVQQLVSAQV
jgi:hypothetical protein